jgi:nucleotide-binding universal stress UspA family protein
VEEPGLTLVAGIANPNDPDVAVRAAVELARLHGAALHLVHAVPQAEIGSLREDGESIEALLSAYARHIGTLCAPRLALPLDADVHFHARIGSPDQAILGLSAEVAADLVLVGAAPHCHPASHRLGTTARRLMRGAKQPVLVIRLPFTPPQRVLLATDLSPSAVGIANHCIRMLRILSGETFPAVRALLVIDDAVVPAPLPADTLLRAAAAQLLEFVDDFLLQMNPVVRSGLAAEEVVADATEWGADLVVLGTHGRRGLARILDGSVAESVLSTLSCNSLVIPPHLAEFPVPTAPLPADAALALR